MFDSADYQLMWPRDVFAAELKTILSKRWETRWQSRLELLLSEAFTGTEPRDDFNNLDTPGWGDPWTSRPSHGERQYAYAKQLLDAAASLREHTTPRPYWPTRQGLTPTSQVLDRPVVYRNFKAIISAFRRDGYFDNDFPTPCVDDQDPVSDDPEADLEAELTVRLGIPHLWPLEPTTWDDDTFYGLVEVFHDLVARPRDRAFHDYGGCGWHHSGFAIEPARALYPWRLNRLLATSSIDLRLAKTGEDAGRLVRMVDEGRAELVNRALATADPNVRSRNEHAIALFRSRTATENNKRSAILTLAGVLEERRALLKEELFRKDEGALFEIANSFALRHQSESQKRDYDTAYLDWVFWWYLATIELTDRLLERQGPAELQADVNGGRSLRPY